MSGKTEYTENELFLLIGKNYEYACGIHDGFIKGELFGGKLYNLPEDGDEREDCACTLALLAVLQIDQNSGQITVSTESMAVGLGIMKVAMSTRRLAANGYLKQNGVDEYGLPTYKKGKC